MFLDYQQAQVLVYRQAFHQPVTQERHFYMPCQIGDADGGSCCYCWSPSEFDVAPTTRGRGRGIMTLYKWFFLIDAVKNHTSVRFRKDLLKVYFRKTCPKEECDFSRVL